MADDGSNGDDGGYRFSIAPGTVVDGVDPGLFQTVKEATKYLPPGYSAQMTSGFRQGDPRFHGQGKALDVQLIDPQGRALPNYQSAPYFRSYEQFAQVVHQLQPQFAPNAPPIRWGGYFPGTASVYGAKDLMHFDVGLNGQMGGGDWDTGLYDREKNNLPGAVSIGLAKGKTNYDLAKASQTATGAINAASPPLPPPRPTDDALGYAEAPQGANAGNPMTDSPADEASILKRWGVNPSDVNSGKPASAPNSAPSQPPVDDGSAAVLKKWGVDPSALVTSPNSLGTDPQTGFAITRDANGVTSLTDPKTGQVKLQFAPGDYEKGHPQQGSSLGSFTAGVVNGVPIAGPTLLNGVQSAAAATRALANNTPYSTEKANVQAMTAGDVAAHPNLNTAGNITGTGLSYMAGGAIPGVGRALGMGGGSLLANSATGAVSNGLIGAADATARGNDATTGGLYGAAGGAVGPAIGKVIGAVGSGIVNKLSDFIQPSIPGMSRNASNLLAKIIGADGGADVQASLDKLGPDATLADAGPGAQVLAGGLASKPETRAVVNNPLLARMQGKDARLGSDLDTSLGPAESPQSVTDNILALRKKTDAANYAVVHAQQAPVDVSSVVAAIDNKLPTAVGDQRTALNAIRKELVKTPATAAADGTTIPETYQDNSELLHNLRQEIDKTINYGDPGLGVPQGAVQRANGSLVGVRNALDEALKTQVPGMAEADAASAALAKRAEAVQSGTQVLDSGKTATSPDDFAKLRDAMQPGEQIAQNKGIRGEIDRLVGTKKNDLVALQGALQGEGGWNTAKLATAFGPENANALVDAVNREARFAGTYGEVLKGSQTGGRRAANELLNETDPERPNLNSANVTGLALQAAKSHVVNPILDILLKQDSGARNVELAKALVAQGPQRDALMNRLMPIINRSQSASATAGKVGSSSNYLTNALMRAAGIDAGQAFPANQAR